MEPTAVGRVSPAVVAPVAQRTGEFGTITFYYKENLYSESVPAGKWRIRAELRDGKRIFIAERLEGGGFGGDPVVKETITDESAQGLMKQLNDKIPPEDKPNYSVRVSRPDGMRVTALEGDCAAIRTEIGKLERASVNRQEKQWKMQEKQWKMQMWMAILELIQNFGKASGIRIR